MELNLVADTNLFFEARSLEELPWQELNHDKVVVYITKPVLDEIDKHKNGNGRAKKRALAINQRIRAIVNGDSTQVQIQASYPKVELNLALNIQPDNKLATTLDYSRNDDKIIGILSEFIKLNPDKQFCLFTDDTGPAATAKSLGLPFSFIPQGWKRIVDDSSENKKIRDLESELALYRSQEPSFILSYCAPIEDSSVLRITDVIGKALSPAEIDQILDQLRNKHPLKTNFDPPPDLDFPKLLKLRSLGSRWERPDDKAIETYQNSQYPNWIEACRNIMSEMHADVYKEDNAVSIKLKMQNIGSRPASQVRIRFEVKGDFEIVRRSGDEYGHQSPNAMLSDKHPLPVFPSPPKPPLSRRVMANQSPSANFLDKLAISHSAISQLANHNRLIDSMDKGRSFRMAEFIGYANEGRFDLPELRTGFAMPKHDPEAFYYYQWPVDRPVKTGGLRCEIWRHRATEEEFLFDLIFDRGRNANGLILCEVHAENLTEPVISKIEIRQEVNSVSVLDIAREMVSKCK